MNTKYVIKGSTLSDIADAIRGKNGETDKIKTIDFATKISEIDLSTLEYMQIMDLIDNNDYTYSEYEINKVEEYMNKFGGAY